MKKRFAYLILTVLVFYTGNTLAVESGDYVCHWYDRDNNSKWCGVVLKDYGKAVRVEVSEVTCDRFLCIQLNSSECSGHKTLPVGSSGQEITVKKYCLKKP
jgi:hypothetical protein